MVWCSACEVVVWCCACEVPSLFSAEVVPCNHGNAGTRSQRRDGYEDSRMSSINIELLVFKKFINA